MLTLLAFLYTWTVSRTTGQTFRSQTTAIESQFNRTLPEGDPNTAGFEVHYNPIDFGWGTLVTIIVIGVLIGAVFLTRWVGKEMKEWRADREELRNLRATRKAGSTTT